MSQVHIASIASELSIRPAQALAVAALLEEGSTVPFIARYRKEATGALDEVAIAAVRDRLAQLKELDERRETILTSMTEMGKLTDELKARILAAATMAVLEDIYLPYRPKRRTRATIAREKGLEPLAERIFAQLPDIDPLVEAAAYVDAAKEVNSPEDALAGARDIIAERISEDSAARASMRELYFKHGLFTTRVVAGKEEEGNKYRNYFEWQEPVSSAPSHRILAMRRGSKEDFLVLRIVVPDEMALADLRRRFVVNASAAAAQVDVALGDSWKRLLSPAMETEIRLATRRRADEEAVKVFAENLRQLLLAPPLGHRNVLALDPGFRTGCKLVCLDSQGKLLYHDVAYLSMSKAQAASEGTKILALCQKFNVQAIAIGNGTGGRETEAVIRSLGLPSSIAVIMVNESGASVYSASEAAREEFPDEDLTVRGAVSIGRRLMDPLAELVKIDPKSIGVGQYQHDVDQALLKKGLDDVVESAVNSVGVEVNTASKQLLMYVSGLGQSLAKNIVDYRNQHGPFKARKELMSVPRLGETAFQQAAGFLRISNAANPLDSSAVHPESYHVVDRMAADLGCTVADLVKDPALRKKISLAAYVTETVGLPTLNDIMQELARPGRDPRKEFELFAFAEGISKIEELSPGMRIPGIVTNITAFGVFVDVGVHQDGLVHVSQLADRFVKDPAEVVSVAQKVMVTVLEVDPARKRISLSMKNQPGEKAPSSNESAPRPRPAKEKPAQNKPAQESKPGRLIDRLTFGS